MRHQWRSFSRPKHAAYSIVLAAGVTIACIAAVADSVIPSSRVTSFVWVRTAPDTESAKVGKLTVGESADLVGQVPRWYEVTLSDGTRGFVSKAWTTITQGLSELSAQEIRIHYLNVGTGTCTLVECPGANSPPMIVDCGSTGRAAPDLNADEVRQYTHSVILRHSVAPNVVLSHADRDHYSFISTILGEIQAQHIWLGGNQADYGSDGFQEWLGSQIGGGAQLHEGFPENWSNSGQPLGLGLNCGPAATYVLTVNTGASKNAQSLVLMIEYKDFTAVFTGDAEGSTEQQAVENYGDSLKATVLTASHHGASTHGSNSVNWATSTNPTVTIFSAGDRFEHPRCIAVQRYSSVASTIEHDVRCGDTGNFRNYRSQQAHYMTRTSGAVIVSSDGHSPLRLDCTKSVECGVQIAHE
jgi:competence protein ComEC